MRIEQITAAAIAVADEAGLAGLAMASVAARLGCTKMALYRYVDAKEDLHTLMLDAALGPAPELPAEDWRAAAAAWADAMLARLAAHPWAVDLLSGAHCSPATRHGGWRPCFGRSARPG